MALPVESKNEDTIAAICTAMTTAGIGIIRVSGPDSIAVSDRIFRNGKGEKALSSYKSNTIHFGHIVDPQSFETIDEVMVSVMKRPHSYTTEDTVEINSHGSLYLLNKILKLVLASGARMAEPGEFTKRAFLGGRIDLAEAEAVMDLISSQNEFARRASISQLSGKLSAKIQELRAAVLYELAFIESALDDPENYDTTGYPEKLKIKIDGLIDEMDSMLANADNTRILREGVKTVITGSPNTGKSSLMNFLLGTDRAIVTEVAGTTRDTLEETVRIGDVVLKLVDTAGIRQTDDKVEKIGVYRAKAEVSDADLILFLIDTSRMITDEDREIAKLLKTSHEEGQKVIVLLNKSDLQTITSPEDIYSMFADMGDNKPHYYVVSLKDGSGMDAVRYAIADMFRKGDISSNNEVYLTDRRHAEALANAEKALRMVAGSIDSGMSEDFYSIDLMNCYSELGKITGDQVDDDLVEEIFSKFCLGK